MFSVKMYRSSLANTMAKCVRAMNVPIVNNGLVSHSQNFATKATSKVVKPRAKRGTVATASRFEINLKSRSNIDHPLDREKWVVQAVSKETNLDQRNVKAVLQSFLKTLKEGIMSGKSASFTNFGKFYQKSRKAYSARNPKTGAAVPVPAKVSFAFKVSSTLRVAK